MLSKFLKSFFHKLTTPVRNNRGVAIMMAIFSYMILMVIVMELAYDTQVEYQSISHDVNTLQARYSAKAGVEFSLLRILLYKQALAMYGDKLPDDQKSMFNIIWSFPFAWPLSNFTNSQENISSYVKAEITKMEKDSVFNGNYFATITPAEGKIDINQLASPIEGLVTFTKEQLLRIFEKELESNKDFEDKYIDTDFKELVDNIVDWVDEDSKGSKGSNESEAYREDFPDEKLPPNQRFKTLDELHMVSGMTDVFYNLLINQVTIHGAHGINVNFAQREVLQAIDPQMEDEILTKIIKRRSDKKEGGPFSSAEEFYNYLESIDPASKERIVESKIPLLFKMEYNFNIKSISTVGKTIYTINATTFDFENLKEELVTSLDKQYEEQIQNNTQNQNNDASQPQKPNNDTDAKKTKTKVAPPEGRPIVVEWREG